MRSFGIVQTASLKLISDQVALDNSDFLTMVSNSSLIAALYCGDVPTQSM